jgi:hypothetical protein
MTDSQKLRRHVRQVLEEQINNFLQHEEETDTKQLKNTAPKSQVIGDPVSDVEMNQLADELGSDEANAPTVAVKARGSRGGTDFTTGQPQANFEDKTELAK